MKPCAVKVIARRFQTLPILCLLRKALVQQLWEGTRERDPLMMMLVVFMMMHDKVSMILFQQRQKARLHVIQM
jgi:hypothetical protein